MHEAMTYVCEHLKEDASISDRLLCVSRLRVIALALGEEKTRTELLPFLCRLRDQPVCASAEANSLSAPNLAFLFARKLLKFLVRSACLSGHCR